jgi:long-chain fatty acid transport protein
MKIASTLWASLLAAGGGVVLALVAGLPAYASGCGLREGSPDWIGTGTAGDEAKAYDASTAWTNPAGMALLDQDQFDGAISLIAPAIHFRGSATTPDGATVPGSQGGNDIAPAAAGVNFGVLALGPDWRIGFSVTAPFGERTAYPEDFVGRYQGLVSSITDINFGLAVSYKINDQLSIGAGPNFDYFDARLTQALYAGQLSQLTGQDPIADVHGNSLGVGYNIGILYKLDDATRIGADYHSRIRHNLTTSQTVAIPAIYGALDPAIVPVLQAANTAATTSITLPDDLSIGIYHQMTPRLALMGSVQWTDWSLLNTINITPTNGTPGTVIEEHWRNTWLVAAGANYQLTDKLMLQSGFAYDESPVDDENRSVRVPDADHYDLGAGVQYQLLPAARVELGYLHVFSRGGNINNSSTPASGTIIGRYDISDNSVTLGLHVVF